MNLREKTEFYSKARTAHRNAVRPVIVAEKDEEKERFFTVYDPQTNAFTEVSFEHPLFSNVREYVISAVERYARGKFAF